MERIITRERFIRLGAALSVSTVGASVLAGCSGGSGGNQAGGGSGGGSSSSQAASSSSGGSSSGQGGATTSSGSKKPQQASGPAIARVSEVPPGSAVTFKESGQPAVLVHLQSGKFVAYSAVCTHQGCTVAYRNGQLACPCHGSIFDPANNGQVISPPAQRPLPQIPIQVSGGEIVRA